ncbi:hypothetical protein GGS23DRAFT_244313 [Durotheca rogersii]|uniref:uncharacterized protein n=1 Tax=Durotheca rogersii TaxID=419775 RepID=UPI00221FC3CD|nr:uncharacterized protein GGS23DRAFT_244313 [Durotheca rogersii]KAI5860298.1 hypothetical protein GGS23DRAFT_244313 [Durotheca rogersii]
MLLLPARIAPTYGRALLQRRGVSTLSTNPFIKVFPNAALDHGHLLTYLDTNPPIHRLAIGSTTTLPPTPRSFSENGEFLAILTDVLRHHAAEDPDLIAQARAFAGPGGATLGSGGAFFARQQRQRGTAAGLGGGGASAQGGAGGAGIGGHIHLSDRRNPPDYGRIAWPEDILGSIEVDGSGAIVGRFEPSGTYRILTNEGILGLSDFLRTKLVERLKEEERRG